MMVGCGHVVVGVHADAQGNDYPEQRVEHSRDVGTGGAASVLQTKEPDGSTVGLCPLHLDLAVMLRQRCTYCQLWGGRGISRTR